MLSLIANYGGTTTFFFWRPISTFRYGAQLYRPLTKFEQWEDPDDVLHPAPLLYVYWPDAHPIYPRYCPLLGVYPGNTAAWFACLIDAVLLLVERLRLGGCLVTCPDLALPSSLTLFLGGWRMRSPMCLMPEVSRAPTLLRWTLQHFHGVLQVGSWRRTFVERSGQSRFRGMFVQTTLLEIGLV